ncbi:LysM peptidoglycan-binding domain-containing protein [Nocardioides sp. AE5]|uniref:LysM peptidoglycan-binding domain-containing protein n=1 Tax=Nocardioides sp. AE5 TaxID=2962573 RepID=UPI0028824981|nr:LysM peptidoglycan-binding domain-containing protein [Nocardioides sp. AE5]MDT0200904.1 LysM peptidoglycan-binding domain-containing protein [Nocardioides sp. AE5]
MSTMTLSPAPALPSMGSSQLRLTRRGRLVIFTLALMVVLATVLFLGAASMATNEAGVEQETEIVMVGYGETLWDIAGGLAASGETRDMVERIKDLNGLDSSMVMAGQEIHVPVVD